MLSPGELIDKTQYSYALLIEDENGTHAQTGSLWFDVVLTGSIAALRPF